jgi:hypothetical protein
LKRDMEKRAREEEEARGRLERLTAEQEERRKR